MVKAAAAAPAAPSAKTAAPSIKTPAAPSVKKPSAPAAPAAPAKQALIIKIAIGCLVVGVVVVFAIDMFKVRTKFLSLFKKKKDTKSKEKNESENPARDCSNFEKGGCEASDSHYKRNSSKNGNSLEECCVKKTCSDVSCGSGRKKRTNAVGTTRNECCEEKQVLVKNCSRFSCSAEFGPSWMSKTTVSEWVSSKKECCVRRTCADIPCRPGRVKKTNANGNEENACCRDKTCEDVDCPANGRVARPGAVGSTASACCQPQFSCDEFDCTNYGGGYVKRQDAAGKNGTLESCCRKRTCHDVECGPDFQKRDEGEGSSEASCCEPKTTCADVICDSGTRTNPDAKGSTKKECCVAMTCEDVTCSAGYRKRSGAKGSTTTDCCELIPPSNQQQCSRTGSGCVCKRGKRKNRNKWKWVCSVGANMRYADCLKGKNGVPGLRDPKGCP